MQKVIQLKSSRFYYKVNVAQYVRENERESKSYKRAVIVVVDSVTEKTRVHDFTEFISKKYKTKRIKTQVDYAGKIVRFLNYIKNKTNNKSFKSIDLDDISSFLQEVAIDANKESVNHTKRIIKNFIYYLVQKKFLINISKENFYEVEKYYKGKLIKINEIDIEDPESSQSDDGDTKSRNTHSMSYALQAMFLNIAYEEVNIIALGVALQMFGGLRVGEVVNLTYSGVQTIGRFGRFGLLLDLKNRDLRNNISLNQGKGYVKSPRAQQIFSPYNIIEPLLEGHIRKYKNNPLEDAVFVNYNGQPMSYDSYQYYFRKLKKIFLLRLNESKDPKLKVQGLILMSKRWGTHIGRGIFTNNFVNITENPTQLQNIRGDKSIETHSIYVDDSDLLGERLEENAEGAFRELLINLNKQ